MLLPPTGTQHVPWTAHVYNTYNTCGLCIIQCTQSLDVNQPSFVATETIAGTQGTQTTLVKNL